MANARTSGAARNPHARVASVTAGAAAPSISAAAGARGRAHARVSCRACRSASVTSQTTLPTACGAAARAASAVHLARSAGHSFVSAGLVERCASTRDRRPGQQIRKQQRAMQESSRLRVVRVHGLISELCTSRASEKCPQTPPNRRARTCAWHSLTHWFGSPRRCEDPTSEPVREPPCPEGNAACWSGRKQRATPNPCLTPPSAEVFPNWA